jgi:phage gp36-like protein
MPDPKDVILHASATEATSGIGPVIDVGSRTYSEVTLAVTAISGNLTVTIESSAAQLSWEPLGYFKEITAVLSRVIIVPDGKRYLRARWSITGSTTFAVTATVHQLYATPSDVAKTGIAAGALDQIPLVDIATACLNASSEAEGYLAASTTLPITSLDAATRQHIARMALFETFRFKPSQVATHAGMIEIGRSDALSWLTKVAAGKLKPVELVDSSTTTPGSGSSGTGSAGGAFVISLPSRRW